MGSRHDELRGRVGVATGRPAWAHGHATNCIQVHRLSCLVWEIWGIRLLTFWHSISNSSSRVSARVRLLSPAKTNICHRFQPKRHIRILHDLTPSLYCRYCTRTRQRHAECPNSLRIEVRIQTFQGHIIQLQIRTEYACPWDCLRTLHHSLHSKAFGSSTPFDCSTRHRNSFGCPSPGHQCIQLKCRRRGRLLQVSVKRYRKKILLGIDMRFKLLFKNLPMTCDRSILGCYIELLFPFPAGWKDLSMTKQTWEQVPKSFQLP